MYVMIASVLAAVTLCLDTVLYLEGRADHSWGTMGLIFIGAPAVHLTIITLAFFVGLALCKTPGFRWRPFAAISVLIPLSGLLVCEAALLSIQVHGC